MKNQHFPAHQLQECFVRLQNGQERIPASIEAALRRSSTLASQGVWVEMHGDTVILLGDARSERDCREAERLAWATAGVARVQNDIEIMPWTGVWS